MSEYQVTKADCALIINDLAGIFKKTGLENEISLMIYGSCLGRWKNGLSDLDALVYFERHLPVDFAIRTEILEAQKEIRKLYETYHFIKPEFFADIFIVDLFHAEDGRFMVLDKNFLPFNPNQSFLFGDRINHKIIMGNNFVPSLEPRILSLRDSKEFELAMGLHKLRNYLFFSIPIRIDNVTIHEALNLIKPFKVLGPGIKMLLGEPLIETPYKLSHLREYFGNIDEQPISYLLKNASSPDSLKNIVLNWHQPGNTHFLECLECYEKILVQIVLNEPKKSQ